MGCDIHPYVEMKTEEGKWVNIFPVDNKYKHDPDSGYAPDWEFDRSYTCFSVLADVRNNYDMKPIAEPRGIPEDASDTVKEAYAHWDSDAHSASWLALPELISCDWSQSVTKNGWVDLEQFKTFLATGQPTSWCGGVGGGNVRHVSNEDMRRLSREGQSPDDLASYYTEISWGDNYRDSCGVLLEFVEKLKKLGDPEHVRIVFWFDN